MGEYTEHEKESKQGTDEIKKLKEELQELKTRSAIETSFLEKKLRAKENATLRIFAQKEKALEEEHDHLKRMIHLEESVHDKIDKRDKLREDRGKGLEERTKKEDRKREDMARLRTREEEQRNQVMQEKQESEQEEQQKLAIFQLQEEGRLYLNRVRARLAAKKQKKGKKGKKKK